ncbi:MAG: DUF4198 domain-containing protein [Sphingomicrobium sp.]
MRGFAAIVIGLALTGTASAHDFWLQPQSWQVAPGKPLPFIVEVGHGSFRQQWGADGGHLLALNDLARGGAVDVRPLFKPGGEVPHLTRTFRREGLHIVSLVSTNAASDLPSIRFNDYLKAEGLTPAIEARTRQGKMNANGRELYSRRAKALVQVGRPSRSDDAFATRPIGLTLEIVPLRNPYSLAADHILPLQILYEGRPLPGALVKLTSLEFDAKPLRIARSDARGHVGFEVPPVGSWLVNVIWTKAVSAPTADFMTVFSSLTFGYSAKRGR